MATPLRESKGVYGRAETCEVWTWIGGKPRQKGEKKGMKRMTGDKRGWAWGRCGWRVDNEEKERWREGWQVIVAVGVTGSRRKTEERMRKCIDIPHEAVSSQLKESLWRLTLPFTLTLCYSLSILWLPLANASALRWGKTKNGYNINHTKPKKYQYIYNIWSMQKHTQNLL